MPLIPQPHYSEIAARIGIVDSAIGTRDRARLEILKTLDYAFIDRPGSQQNQDSR